MSQPTVYDQLSQSIGAPGSPRLPKIFQALADEREAAILLAASPPATPQELAEKTGLSLAEVEEALAPLFMKGVMFTSEKPDGVRYYRVRNVGQFHDASILTPGVDRAFLDLWKDYMDNEWEAYMAAIDRFITSSVMRVIPVNVSLEPQTAVMAFDDIKNVIQNARAIAVTNCTCRMTHGECGKPVEVCIQLDKAADYNLKRGTGRPLSKDEALAMLRMCEEEGLVHTVGNVRSAGHVICNCCGDCCMNWPGARKTPTKFVSPSRFAAVVDEDLCTACEACLDRCYFEAITMDGENGCARVDPEACMGCGLCLLTCPSGALGLKETRPQEFVPAG